MQKGHTIKSVDPGSIADELGLEPGDRLLSIDGHELEDIFDYEYYIENESIVAVVAKKNGEEWELDIENDYQDLGLTFENGLQGNKVGIVTGGSQILTAELPCRPPPHGFPALHIHTRFLWPSPRSRADRI